MEHKTFSVEIKALDYAGRTVEGYAAAFGNIDGVGDIIHPGAFKQTLSERGGKIKFLWQHDPSEPIGKLLHLQEEPGGLAFKAAISDTARGRDALALLKDGALGEMSIGYDTVKGGMDYSKSKSGDTVRNLRALKLYEISLVTFPANEQAIVTGLKQQDIMPAESKPYRNVPDELTDKMDSCVEQVMAKGQDKETAIAICYASVVEGKSLAEAFQLQGYELKELDFFDRDEIEKIIKELEKYFKPIKMDFVSDDQRRAVFANLSDSGGAEVSRCIKLVKSGEKTVGDIENQISYLKDSLGRVDSMVEHMLANPDFFDEDQISRAKEKAKERADHISKLIKIGGLVLDGLNKSMNILHEQKAGRVLSSANVNRIMAAMAALHEALAAAGVNMDGEGEMMPEKSNSDIIEPLAETAQPAPANADDIQPHNSTTPGPDTSNQAKPASVLLREIDIYLAELDTLEVWNERTAHRLPGPGKG